MNAVVCAIVLLFSIYLVSGAVINLGNINVLGDAISMYGEELQDCVGSGTATKRSIANWFHNSGHKRSFVDAGKVRVVVSGSDISLTSDFGASYASLGYDDSTETIIDAVIIFECQVLDQCHEKGVYDPALGACTNPIKTNGTSCDDGDMCTQTDTCQAGTCVGNSVVCSPLDQCHTAGVCNPTTGCSNPEKAAGSACDDGSVCTQTDTCQSGVCVGSSNVTCTASDQCHLAGVCDPVSGCSNPPKPDSTPCDDALVCTNNDQCSAGVCTGTTNCPAACGTTAGTCNPSTNQCSYKSGEVPLPSQCCSYTTNSDATRLSSAPGSSTCDTSSLIGDTWYRFTQGSGVIDTSVVAANMCGTQASAWSSTAMPTVPGNNINITICLTWGSNNCNWDTKMQATNCNSFYVYKTATIPVPVCSARICVKP